MKRREFLKTGSTALLAGVAGQAAAPRKKIAALSTTYHVRSHSDNFITRFLEGYWINEKYYPPPCDIVSLYMDQVHAADIGHRLAASYGFPVVKEHSRGAHAGYRKTRGRWSSPDRRARQIPIQRQAAATLSAL